MKYNFIPWYFDADSGNSAYPNGLEYLESEDAQRAVACVNACEGIADPSVVPEILAQLKVLRDKLIQYAGPENGLYEVTEANAIIARAEGR